jgi:uncharacterized membrane protein YvbJ
MAQRKPYNNNTAYGRKKLREQAANSYQNGTPEYRKEIDNMAAVVWIIIIVIGIIIGVIIFNTSGIEGVNKWLK